MRPLGIAALLVPTLAFAQASEDPPPSSVGAGQPGVASDPWAFHRGVTFEANLGVGRVNVEGDGRNANTDVTLAVANLGLGGWKTPQLAVTFRVAGMQVSNDTATGVLVHAFVGPSVQYWIYPHFWVGAGLGLSTLRCGGGGCSTVLNTDVLSGSPVYGSGRIVTNGLGFDFRAGYTFGGSSRHTFNVSVEANPGFYRVHTEEQPGMVLLTSIALLAGYQFL